MPERIDHLLLPMTQPLRRAGAVLRTYDRQTLRQDLLAGLTVAIVAVPQAMAYAIIAGVAPQYGLYTVMAHTLIGTLFCGQPRAAVGPINTQSLLIASIITRLVSPDLEPVLRGQMLVQLAICLALLKGVMQILMAYAHLGGLVKYVSQAVIVGFTAGAGILIAAGQVPGFLGIAARDSGPLWPGLIGNVQKVAPYLEQASMPAVVIGLMSLVILIIGRRISRLFPAPLLVIFLGGLAVYCAGWTAEDLSLITPLPTSLPAPAWPDLTLLIEHHNALLAGALALALLGLMEAFAVAKKLTRDDEPPVDANQELFAQGMTNFLGSFLNSIPGSSSFARSSLNQYAGAQTFVSGLFTGVCVVAIYLLFAPLARYVPMAAIAAVLFVIAWGLIDFSFIRRVMRTSRVDTYACLGTLGGTLVFPLEYAVFFGIFLNIALYLRRSSQLHIGELVRRPGGPFMERPLNDRSGQQQVIFVQLEGDLFFAVADELDDQLRQLARSPVRVVILRLKRTHWMDTTVLMVLERFVNAMRARDGYVVLCGVRPDLIERLDRFGLLARIGKDNVFETAYGIFTSARRAIERARVLVGSSLDAEELIRAASEEEASWDTRM